MSMPARPDRSIFVSHGAPTIVLDGSPANRFLAGLGERLGRPSAIVVATAHWTTRVPTLSAAPSPATIHDFGDFDPRLFEMRYPAPGAPALAAQAADALRAAGLPVAIDVARGFDHGVWTPLMLMYPRAEIPVVSLSVQPQMSPAHHIAVGRALRALTSQDVLVIGSGAATHDLRRFRGARLDAPEADDVRLFAEWLNDATTAGDEAALSAIWDTAPGAHAQHPSPEHLMPFHVAFGAGDGRGHRLHRSTSFGFLAMDAYGFGTA
jgi:4,5-DOPA dioxygenase extradiol